MYPQSTFSAKIRKISHFFIIFIAVKNFSILYRRVIVMLGLKSLRERLRTHKFFTKDQNFYLNYHKFSIKSYVLDVY